MIYAQTIGWMLVFFTVPLLVAGDQFRRGKILTGLFMGITLTIGCTAMLGSYLSHRCIPSVIMFDAPPQYPDDCTIHEIIAATLPIFIWGDYLVLAVAAIVLFLKRRLVLPAAGTGAPVGTKST